jgi:hypothetical protein
MVPCTTRRNRRSRFTAETRIQLLRCRPVVKRAASTTPRRCRRSSDPLVGGLPLERHGSVIRWLEWVALDASKRPNPVFRKRVPRARPCAVQFAFSGATPPGLCGGDEETRTPDPLLAKEMLFQLSYVPPHHVGCGDGGRFWTRTRDLCLIRAVL